MPYHSLSWLHCRREELLAIQQNKTMILTGQGSGKEEPKLVHPGQWIPHEGKRSMQTVVSLGVELYPRISHLGSWRLLQHNGAGQELGQLVVVIRVVNSL